MTPKVRVKVRPPGQPHTKTASPTKAFDRSSRPRTWLDESDAAIYNSYKFDEHTPITNTRGSTRADKWQFFYSFLIIHGFFKKPHLCTTTFSPKFLSFTDDHRATPVQNTAQGADVQQGPVTRTLFRLRPYVNLSYYLLFINIPRFPTIAEEEAGVLACGHVRIFARTWTPGAYYKGHCLGSVYTIKTEYLRECLASRVWPYMHQLRIMSLVKCWVCPAPVFCCLTFRSIG